MSFLTTATEELLAAQSLLEGVNTNLAAQNAGAASATTIVAPAGADPVSIQQAALFSTYGTTYQTIATEAQAQLETYTTNLGVSSNSYGDAESANAASAVLSDAVQPAATDAAAAAAAPGPGSSLLDILQYLLGGTGNFTNPSMLGGMFGLSGNSANILNIGAKAPRAASVSFHARLCASCKPVFMPCPPTGGWICAASPARNTRPRE